MNISITLLLPIISLVIIIVVVGYIFGIFHSVLGINKEQIAYCESINLTSDLGNISCVYTGGDYCKCCQTIGNTWCILKGNESTCSDFKISSSCINIDIELN